MPAVEIGWRLARDVWGQGLATEAAQAALRFGFDEVGLDRVLSIIQFGNGASECIAQNIGMSVERDTVDPSCCRAVRVYETSRAPQC